VGDTHEDMEAANAARMIPIWINRPDMDILGNSQDFEHALKNEPIQINNKTERRWKTISNLRELLLLG
jgi:hypothetical protein